MAVNGYAAAQDVADLKVSTAALAVAMGNRVNTNEDNIAAAAAVAAAVPGQLETLENSIAPIAIAAATTEANAVVLSMTPFASVAEATASVIKAEAKRITTRFRTPSYAAPGTLVGGASYRRVPLSALTGISARAQFRSTDRFMPDGTTDDVNGGYWLLDEVDVFLDHLGVFGDGTDESANINGALAACATLGKPANLRPGKTYRADTAFSLLVSINGNGATLKGKANVQASGVRVCDTNLEVVGGSPLGVTIAGTSGTPLRDVTLERCKITFDAGTTVIYRQAINANYVTNLMVRDCNIMYGVSLLHCPDYSFIGNRIDGEYLNNNELIHASAKSYGLISGNTFLRSNDNWIDLYSSGERTVISNNRFVGLKSFLGTGIEIKVSITDNAENTSGEALGWAEQIIIEGNYFGGAIAYSSLFSSYINIYYIDTRAMPVFLWSEAPRNIIVANNIFDGWDGTLHGTGYFAALILNKVCAATVMGNIFRNMTLQATGSEWSSCIWIEDCKDLIVTGNRGAMRYGCGISLHGANDGLSISGNHLLYDENGGFKSKYGIAAQKVGSRADPTMTNCTVGFNKVDGTSRALRFPYYAAGGLTECHITGNDCRAFSNIERINKSRITDNSFAGTADGAVQLGTGSAITAHNTVAGNTFKTPTGNTLAGCFVYRMRASSFTGNRAFAATEGLWFLGTGVDGELNDLTVNDNYSVGQTGASFPRYSTMHATDTASLVATNNRKVAA